MMLRRKRQLLLELPLTLTLTLKLTLTLTLTLQDHKQSKLCRLKQLHASNHVNFVISVNRGTAHSPS